jgi:hypothetical protein
MEFGDNLAVILPDLSRIKWHGMFSVLEEWRILTEVRACERMCVCGYCMVCSRETTEGCLASRPDGSLLNCSIIFPRLRFSCMRTLVIGRGHQAGDSGHR